MSLIFNPSARTEEQKLYCEMVDKYSQKRTNSYISNGKPEHAIYLISKLFGMAEKHIRIYSDKLKDKLLSSERSDHGDSLDFYGNDELLKKLLPFFSTSGTKLDIVVEKDIENIESHSLLAMIKDMKSSGNFKTEVTLKKLDKEGLDILADIDFQNHFIVSDCEAFRLEIDHEPLNYQARANFGDIEISRKLVSIFEAVHMNYSKEIAL